MPSFPLVSNNSLPVNVLEEGAIFPLFYVSVITIVSIPTVRSDYKDLQDAAALYDG